MAADLHPLLESSWQKVLDNWEQPAVHDSFVSICFEHALLGFAANKYRSQLDSPERCPLAQKKIAATILLATQTLESGKTQATAPVLPRWLLLVAVAMTASSIGWLLFVLSR